MNPLTPDPKKRGYLLPPGCKDLHDLLQPRKRRQPSGGHPGATVIAANAKQALADAQATLRTLGMKRSGDVVGRWRLAELVPSAVALVAPEAQLFWLSLHAAEAKLDVSMRGGQAVATHVSLHAEIGSERNRAIREFCTRHGFPLPRDGPLPPSRWPGLPVDQIYDLQPEAAGVAVAAEWARKLFLEVGGLTDEARVDFCYDDVTAVGDKS